MLLWTRPVTLRPAALTRWLLVAPLAAAVALPALAEVQSAPRAEVWSVDGAVNGLAAHDGILYVGGDFGVVGRNTGPAVVYDPNGTIVQHYPLIDGEVLATAPDGAGGWFIGGEFTAVGGVARQNLARLRSDGSLDPNWNPGAGSAVYALARSNQTLYIGGAFTTLGGAPRNRLGAVSTTTGAVATWNPNSSGPVYALLVSLDGTKLYVGGDYQTFGGGASARNRLAAFAVPGGTLAPWDPNADALVGCLAQSPDGGTVYAGGRFQMVGGEVRYKAAGIDAGTGVVTSFAPLTGPFGCEVRTIDATADRIYVGGTFQAFGLTTRNYLAELEPNGAPTGWDPQPNALVNRLLVDGDTVYVGGNFREMGGQAVWHFAAVDRTTGTAAAGTPIASNNVNVLVKNGAGLFVGGGFNIIGGVFRKNLAAIDLTTGQATSWDPQTDDYVECIALSHDRTTLYAAGRFGEMGGQFRGYMAEISLATGAPTAWNPQPEGGFGLISPVNTIAVGSDAVYIGGDFYEVGGTARSSLAAVDPVTGALTAWDPSPDGSVAAIVLGPDVAVVGGYFSQLGSVSQAHLALIDLITGLPVPWAPDPNEGVQALAATMDALYVGGEFTNIAGQTRAYAAAFDALTGEITPWAPLLSFAPLTLEAHGLDVYAGGAGLARINRINGAQDPQWTPAPNDLVETICISGHHLAIGGRFDRISGQPWRGLVVYSQNTAPAAQNLALTVAEDSAGVSGTFAAADAENDPFTFAIAAPPARGVVTLHDVNTGAFTYIPVPDAFGTDTFSYRASDGDLAGTAVVTVTITPTPDAPVAGPIAVTIDEDQAVTLFLFAGDADQTPLTYALVQNGTLGAAVLLNAATGEVRYTPLPNVSGTDAFTYQASDGVLLSNIATVTVNILAVNDAPVCSGAAYSVAAGASVQGTLAATDVESDSLTFSIATLPVQGSVVLTNAQTGAFTYTATAGASGADSFTFTASDGVSTSAAATVTLNIFVGETVFGSAPVNAQGNAVVEVTNTGGQPQASVAVVGGVSGSTLAVTVQPFATAGLNAYAGFGDGGALDKVLSIEGSLGENGSALIELFYTAEELGALDPTKLRLFRWSPATQQWELAATRDRGLSAPTYLVGDCGVDLERGCVWAVVDHFSQFAAGEMSAPPFDPQPLACGACGPVSPLTILLTCGGVFGMRIGLRRRYA